MPGIASALMVPLHAVALLTYVLLQLLQAPDSTALDFFGLTSFEDIIDVSSALHRYAQLMQDALAWSGCPLDSLFGSQGKYENVLLESSLGLGGRGDPASAQTPPIYTEIIEVS